MNRLGGFLEVLFVVGSGRGEGFFFFVLFFFE